MDGICTLANDRIYDQLVALLNSIEANMGKDIPVCVYPFDDNTERIAAEIAKRPNVQIYDDYESIKRWEEFGKAIWDTHPNAFERWNRPKGSYHRLTMHRRFCAFDGHFDKYIYMDGDTLLMGTLEPIFTLLNDYDCVVYDFQYKDPTHVYEVASPKLTEIFPEKRIETEIFCSGFYGSKKDLFDQEKRDWLITQLKNGEAEILYPLAPINTIISYMMMRSGCSIYNLALQLPAEKKTGCCVTSPHFQTKENILYDKGQPLTYLHYIGLSSQLFADLCAGKNIDFPYRDIFLHYRYLHEPEKRPQFTSKPKPYNQPASLLQRISKKIGLK